MTNIVKFEESAELKAIEPSKAAQIKATFEPMVEMLEQFEAIYNQIVSESQKGVTKELCAKAKRARLDVGKIRINTGKAKDKSKESLKREDRAIMGVHNLVVWAVTDRENKLKEIENFFEIQEQKRLEALQAERVEKLSQYIEDAHERNLSDMEEDVWQAYLGAKKKEYQDRIEAEKKAEAERLEQQRRDILESRRRHETYHLSNYIDDYGSIQLGELSTRKYNELVATAEQAKKEYEILQQEIREENERMKKEAEEIERQAEILKKRNEVRRDELRPYIIFIQDYDSLINSDEKSYQKDLAKIKEAAIQHWENEREKKAERERIDEENRKKWEAERKKRERLEIEQANIRAQEAARIAEQKRIEKEKAEAAKKAAQAPDKEKIVNYINSLDFASLDLKTDQGKMVLNTISQKFDAFKTWALQQTESL